MSCFELQSLDQTFEFGMHIKGRALPKLETRGFQVTCKVKELKIPPLDFIISKEIIFHIGFHMDFLPNIDQGVNLISFLKETEGKVGLPDSWSSVKQRMFTNFGHIDFAKMSLLDSFVAFKSFKTFIIKISVKKCYCTK